MRERLTHRLGPVPSSVRVAHARWYLTKARAAIVELTSPSEPAGRRALNGILDELRAAHRWSTDHERPLALALSFTIHPFAQSSLNDVGHRDSSSPACRWRCRASKHAMSTEPHVIVAFGAGVRKARIAERSFQLGELMKVEPVRLGRPEAHELLPDRERHRRQTARLEDSMHLAEHSARVRDHIHRRDGPALSWLETMIAQAFPGVHERMFADVDCTVASWDARLDPPQT